MKVKELIAELSKLDQEKGIWIFHNYPTAAFAPIPIGKAMKQAEEVFGKEGVKEGDYVIDA